MQVSASKPARKILIFSIPYLWPHTKSMIVPLSSLEREREKKKSKN